MNRRHFLWSAAASIVSALRAAGSPMPLGYNTYCLRSLRYNDQQLLDFAVRHKLDAIFLQDSLDPRAQDPSHWPEVRKQAADLGLHLETGGGAILPKTPGAFPASVETLRKQIVRAKALGSPLVRALLASDRASLPPGSIDEHIATAVRLLQTVRSQVMDAGLKIAIEVHKDLQAWEHKQLIEAAGKDFVGIYLDTGNPVFVLEHPLTTLETLGQYALTLHLRDSIVYEHKRGVAVQWVPLGEGVVDFKQILARAREFCPHVFVYIKPITGRPPHVIPYLEESFWKAYPRARAGDLARFLALAKNGHPYERPVVIEDLQDRPLPEQFRAAVQFQQQDHMERSIAYAKNTLDLGIRWRA